MDINGYNGWISDMASWSLGDPLDICDEETESVAYKNNGNIWLIPSPVHTKHTLGNCMVKRREKYRIPLIGILLQGAGVFGNFGCGWHQATRA